MSDSASQSSPVAEGSPPPFQEEFLGYWRKVPDKGLFLGLAVPWLLLFQFLGNSTLGYGASASLYEWMASIYGSDFSDESHGFLIPFVVAYLLWDKREELARVESRNWAAGLVALGGAAAMHVIGFAIQQGRVSVVALFVGLYAIMGIVWGGSLLKAAFFPYVLFVFCMPLGGLTDSITVPLRVLVTEVSVWGGANILNADVINDGSRILHRGGDYHYDVAPACSGIRSLTALLILSTIVAFVSISVWWRRLTLIAAAIPVAIAGNVLRITAVIVAGEAFGQDAGALVHDHAWILTWGLALVCMWGLFVWLTRGLEPRTGDAKGGAT